LQQNFPDFKQEETKIGVFGTTTLAAAEEAGIKVDLMAPTKETPSMTMALEKYIKSLHK
jgi:uroporphyrinogen-III synthase